MMHEYEDDFFFEEDKIQLSEAAVDTEMNKETSNLLLTVDVDCFATPDTNQMEREDASKIEKERVTEVDMVSSSFEIDCVFNDLRQGRFVLQRQDLMGMTVTSGSVALAKDEKNLIGISIGGGAPLCPCLYIVQIFDGTPAAKEGTLQSGDELAGVNGQSVKGKTKVEVAKMIQSAKEDVTINYNKLHADPRQGKSLDLIMKKMKHRLVENMSSGTADALGLSRAILCNDTLVAKLNELRDTETMYKRLVEHAKRMLKSYFELLQTYRALGDVFASIGVREPQPRASEAFSKFANYHRRLERAGIDMLKALKPILADMGTYLNKAIPDTKLTIRKYADTKFEYLSYCLKVKEMDDEEHGYNALQEPLYRVETGNYEYRLILRCRQDARGRFARLRSDVLVKLELLDNKRAQDVAYQLRRFIEKLAVFHKETEEQLSENSSLFPVEVDLSQNAFQYKSTTPFVQDNGEDEEDAEIGREAEEHEVSKSANRRGKEKDLGDHSQEQLLPGLEAPSGDSEDSYNITLLTELGLADTSTPRYNEEFGAFQHALGDALLADLGGEIKH